MCNARVIEDWGNGSVRVEIDTWKTSSVDLDAISAMLKGNAQVKKSYGPLTKYIPCPEDERDWMHVLATIDLPFSDHEAYEQAIKTIGKSNDTPSVPFVGDLSLSPSKCQTTKGNSRRFWNT